MYSTSVRLACALWHAIFEHHCVRPSVCQSRSILFCSRISEVWIRHLRAIANAAVCQRKYNEMPMGHPSTTTGYFWTFAASIGVVQSVTSSEWNIGLEETNFETSWGETSNLNGFYDGVTLWVHSFGLRLSSGTPKSTQLFWDKLCFRPQLKVCGRWRYNTLTCTSFWSL